MRSGRTSGCHPWVGGGQGGRSAPHGAREEPGLGGALGGRFSQVPGACGGRHSGHGEVQRPQGWGAAPSRLHAGSAPWWPCGPQQVSQTWFSRPCGLEAGRGWPTGPWATTSQRMTLLTRAQRRTWRTSLWIFHTDEMLKNSPETAQSATPRQRGTCFSHWPGLASAAGPLG